MSFKIPEYLKGYIDAAKHKTPLGTFINNSTYYSQLNYQWQDYMQNVVRPCVAYASGSNDLVGKSLAMNTGYAIVNGAAKIAVGNKLFFEGDDNTVKFFSDIYTPRTLFRRTIHRAYHFMCSGGTSILKLNIDSAGRCMVDAFRIDRVMFTTNSIGEIISANFFIGLIASLENKENTTYWLTEQRYYNQARQKVIKFKVFVKAGTENSPVLPNPENNGVDYKALPDTVRLELMKRGISELNTEMVLPFKDNLGCWLLGRSAINSCVPESFLGDPLLYPVLDILWSIDVVFSGSIVDILNGEGKILVPKQFLQETMSRLKAMNPEGNVQLTTSELNGYGDDTFVYVMPSMFEKDKMSPMSIQFDIRAEQYGKMFEIYERAACTRCGYAPTSIFPYLQSDNSVKTAEEVTAEENLTHATNLTLHNDTLPVWNAVLREIAYQEHFSDDIEMKLSDYVGNKMRYDENERQNAQFGLVPREIAVQRINNLSKTETEDYMAKLDAQRREEERSRSLFGITDDMYGAANEGLDNNRINPNEDTNINA